MLKIKAGTSSYAGIYLQGDMGHRICYFLETQTYESRPFISRGGAFAETKSGGVTSYGWAQ